MTDQQSVFLKIIKSAVTGEHFTVPNNIISPEFLTATARRHHIESLVYYGLLNCGCNAFTESFSSFNDIVMKNIYIDQKQQFLLNVIKRSFTENEICFSVLKGPRMKEIYPKSDMRSMVDLDILIKMKQYKKIKPLLLDLGFVESEESLHELIWYYQDLKIEFHKHLIPSNNKDYFAFFGDGWDFVKPTAENPFEYEMTRNDEFLFLFVHIAKHFRDSGIGIQYFVDLWLYLKHYSVDGDYLENALERLNLTTFYHNFLATLSVWFEDKESTELTDFITDYVFNSRVRGTARNSVLSTGLLAKKYGTVVSGRSLNFLRLVFPDFRRMTVKYPVLKKFPVLLPFCYICRWIEAVFFRKDVIAQHNRELKIQTDENIKKYEEDLKYMGIEYRLDDEKTR